MATTAPDSTGKVSCYEAIVAFINGPDFYVTTGDTLRREKPQPDSKAVDDVPTARVILSARSTADLHSSRQPSRQTSSLGKQPSSVGRSGSSAGRTFNHSSRTPSGAVKTAWQSKGPTTEGFDNNRQVYFVDELSPLPFQPPKFYVHATSMLSGAFKVFQNMITMMVALMMMQHVIERYWSASFKTISIMEKLMMAVFLAYPMVTLLLVILSNNEITVRRFMYYRLMSLQVIVDWQNIPFYKLWFFSYFITSFILVNGYSLYAGVITRHDKTASVFPQWSIMFMQSLLLFIFWLNMVSMEEQLVPLNKVVENSPESAKELITLCDVVQESQLKAVVKQAYRRRRAFKRLPEADQDEAARLLLQTGDSQAAFFDLNALRRTGKKREGRGGTKEDLTAIEDEFDGCFVWLHNLREWLEDLTFRKLYAWYFCLSFHNWHLIKLRRCRQDRAAAGQWPYPGDIAYFHALGIIGSLCFLTVIGVEIYALWFLFFGKDMSDRDTYGILECKQCYTYISVAGETCLQSSPSSKCWAAAMRGFCSMQEAMVNKYGINNTKLIGLNGSACLNYRP